MASVSDYYRLYELDYAITLNDDYNILDKHLDLPCVKRITLAQKFAPELV